MIPDSPAALYDGGLVKSVITSFGYLHGAPPRAPGIRVDLRNALRNPHHDPAMRQLTGLDARVRHHVLATPGARHIIEDTANQVLHMLASGADRASQRVDVHVGCQGGRHRSVAVAEEVAAILRSRGVNVEVEHRDVTKPVVQK